MKLLHRWRLCLRKDRGMNGSMKPLFRSFLLHRRTCEVVCDICLDELLKLLYSLPVDLQVLGSRDVFTPQLALLFEHRQVAKEDGVMEKGKEIWILLLTVSSFLNCDATEYRMPKGYDWMTRGGKLFIKAGQPSRYITVPTSISWQKHSWLEHNKRKPADVEIVPLNSHIKQMIVKEINDRRAKTLLGAYFDPERARQFGVVPPPAELSTVEYNEDIARTTERYIQHYIFDHYIHNSFYPHVPLGENLYMSWTTIPLSSSAKHKTRDEIVNEHFNVTKIVLDGFRGWFDEEMVYYKHYEPYRDEPLKRQLQKLFIAPIKNDRTLTAREKERKLTYVQYGHYTALVAKNVHSVGCALTRKGKVDEQGRYPVALESSFYFACNFGGGMTTDGLPLFDMDENFLQQHGLSKSNFEHSQI